mgnify:CR=1 FL=1
MKPQDFFNQKDKRFFFRDPAKVAAYVGEHCPREAAGDIAAADEVAAQRFMFTLRWDMERTREPVMFDGDIDWLHQPGDDPEWVYAFNRMRFWICLGQAYALTGDEKYAQAFVKQMMHWVGTVKKDDPDCAKAWRSIEVGLRLEYWLKAIQYFKNCPAITGEVIDVFIGSVTEQAEFIMGIWDTYNLMSNWGVLANHGLFLAGVMLPETKRTRIYTVEAARRLAAEIDMQVYRDGSHWEQSPMYHNEVLHCFLDVVLLAQRCGIDLPPVIGEKTLSMCLYDMKSAKPDGGEPMMGDSDDIDQRDQISKGAVIFRDPQLKARGYEEPDFDTIWDIGEEGLDIYRGLSHEVPEKADFFLSDSGNAYLRSGWTEAATWVHFQCGPLGAGHGHADKLHVDLTSRGEDILTDAGRYTYVFGGDRVAFKELRAHNTLMVDGHDLYVCRDSWECDRLTRGVNQRFYADDRYGYAEGGHLGYTALPEGVYLNRRVIYIKPDILILADEFYTAGTHRYNQFFHFGEQGTLTQESRDSWTYLGKKARAQMRFLSPEIRSREMDTRVSRHYNEWTPAKGIETEFSAAGSGCAFTVLGVCDSADSGALTVEKLPVYSNFKHIQFTDAEIEALEIRFRGQHSIVVIAHREYASPTDTFLAGGCVGFGSAVVFDLCREEIETGTVLAW